MKTKPMNILAGMPVRLRATLVFVLLLILMAFNKPAGNDLVIIVNEANPVTAMTASQAKVIYTRKLNRRWKELSKNILPIDRKGEPEVKKLFLKNIVQMSNENMDKYFSEREYQNQETPPVKLSSDEEVINYVEENPGAIGYVMSSSLAGARKVKVILTVNH